MKKLSFIVLFLFFISIIFAIPLAQYQIPYFNLKEKKSYDYFTQGISSFNSSNYKTSQNFFLKSLNLKPDFYFSRKFLAESYYLSGDIESALEEYEILKNQYPYDEFINYKITQLQNQLFTYNNVSIQSEDSPPDFSLWKEIDGKSLNLNSFIPIDIKKDNQYIYCLTYEPKAIFVFDLQGNLQKIKKNLIIDSIRNPNKIFLTNDYILVSDFYEDKIFVLDKNLNRIIRTIDNIPYPTFIVNINDIFYVWSNKDKLFYKYDKNLNFINKIEIRFKNDVNPNIVNFNSPIISTDNENLYMIFNNKLYKIDSSGYILDQIEIPVNNIKTLFFDNKNIYISDSSKIWIKHYLYNEWQLLENFYNIDESKEDHFKNIHFREISSLFKDNNFFLVTDISGKIFIFLEKFNANNNLNVQIMNIESYSYPEIAILLKINDFYNNPIENLNNNNFEIYENNQKVFLINSSNFNKYKDKLNLLILKDINFKIDETYKKLFKNKIYEFFHEFDITDNIYFAYAGENIKVVYNGKYDVELFNLIENNFDFNIKNDLILNLSQGMNHLISLKGKKGILLLTNSEEEFKRNDNIQKLIYFSKIHNIPIYIISFKRNEDLSSIANKTGGGYFNFFENYNFLSIYNALKKQSVSNYLITYKALTPFHKKISNKFINVKIKINYFEYGGAGESGYIIP